jgi:hypothetical protein
MHSIPFVFHLNPSDFVYQMTVGWAADSKIVLALQISEKSICLLGRFLTEFPKSGNQSFRRPSS